MKVKIYYHDTDCGGVVYYANYLKYLEEARTEFFAERGILIKDLVSRGVLFVIARQEIDYELPAVYADTLDIQARLSNIGRAKLEFEYRIKNQSGQLVVEAKTVMVCVDSQIHPQALPKEIRQKLLKSP